MCSITLALVMKPQTHKDRLAQRRGAWLTHCCVAAVGEAENDFAFTIISTYLASHTTERKHASKDDMSERGLCCDDNHVDHALACHRRHRRVECGASFVVRRAASLADWRRVLRFECRTKLRTNERTTNDERRTNEQTNKRTNERTNERTND